MKRIFSVLFFTALTLSAWAQFNGAKYIREHYDKTEAYIQVRDGVKLFTAIYTPKDTSRTYPILMLRTPYSVGPYGADKYPWELGPSTELMEDGYIFVCQDVRGRWMSEGLFDDMRPSIDEKKSEKDIDEGSDTYDTIEWLLAHVRRHNGKVGMWGISYPGFYTSAAMMCGHPALVASSPQAPIADLWRDDAFHYGVFLIPHNFNFYPDFTNRTDGLPTQRPAPGFNHGTRDGYQYFLNLGPLNHAQDFEVFKNDPFWTANLEHPAFDQHWQERNILPHQHHISHAVLVVGGWYDAEDLYGTFKTYKSVEEKNPGIDNFFVVGPWSHGGWGYGQGNRLGHVSFGENTAEYYRKEIERPFFNYYLKGEGDGNFPEARMFETGTNRWRTFDAWPPKEAREERLFLQPSGGLTIGKTPDGKENSFSRYISDPSNPVPSSDYVAIGMPQEYMTDDQRHASKRKDVLVFQTEVLEGPVTLAGNIWAHLEVSTTGADADWIVKVIDVYPGNASKGAKAQKAARKGGYQQMVRSEFFRGRYRKSFENPEPFVPGQIDSVEFELQDVLHTFQKGHRIMVQVQSTFFPIVDRNPQTWVPNIFYAKESDFQKAEHRVYHDAEHTSFLKVRLLD